MGTWNSACLDSIRKEKAEIAKRYGIRFGQAEIYCARCGRPVADPLNHTCQDIRLKNLQKAKKSVNKASKMDVSLSMHDSTGLIAPGALYRAYRAREGVF